MLLPIGLAYDHMEQIVFDPDRSIVDAIRLVFDSFRRKGSAMAVGEVDAPREHRTAVTSANGPDPRRVALGPSELRAGRPYLNGHLPDASSWEMSTQMSFTTTLWGPPYSSVAARRLPIEKKLALPEPRDALSLPHGAVTVSTTAHTSEAFEGI